VVALHSFEPHSRWYGAQIGEMWRNLSGLPITRASVIVCLDTLTPMKTTGCPSTLRMMADSSFAVVVSTSLGPCYPATLSDREADVIDHRSGQ
jgi:hypothetical protein